MHAGATNLVSCTDVSYLVIADQNHASQVKANVLQIYIDSVCVWVQSAADQEVQSQHLLIKKFEDSPFLRGLCNTPL